MNLSFSHKYTLAEAEEGAGAFYGSFTGDTYTPAELALAGCAIVDYGLSLGLPTPNVGAAASTESADELKAKITDMLKPHVDTSNKKIKGAAAINWQALAALVMKLLPLILPLVV